MEDCPFCGGTDTVYYHFLMNVLTCKACGVSQEDFDFDQVEDYLFVDDDYVLVSSHYLPFEEQESGSINYDVLKRLKQKKES